jgi:hypothetical protein
MEKSCRGAFNEQSPNFSGWNKKVQFTCLEGADEARRYSPTLSLTPALDVGGWSTPRSYNFTPWNDLVPTLQEGCGPYTWSGLMQKTSSPPVFDPRTVHSVTSRAIPTELCRPILDGLRKPNLLTCNCRYPVEIWTAVTSVERQSICSIVGTGNTIQADGKAET